MNTPSELQWTANTKTLIILYRINGTTGNNMMELLPYVSESSTLFSMFMIIILHYYDLSFYCLFYGIWCFDVTIITLCKVIFWGNVSWRPQKCSVLYQFWLVVLDSPLIHSPWQLLSRKHFEMWGKPFSLYIYIHSRILDKQLGKVKFMKK